MDRGVEPMSQQGFWEVQVAQAEENALIADLRARTAQLVEQAEEYFDDLKTVAAIRADRGRHLSRINLEVLGWVGEELEQAAAVTEQLRRRGDNP